MYVKNLEAIQPLVWELWHILFSDSTRWGVKPRIILTECWCGRYDLVGTKFQVNGHRSYNVPTFVIRIEH
jgi:hypothetical protein